MSLPWSILGGMSKILYINQTLDEYRAALVEKGKVVDFFMERRGELRVGNIYKGRVSKILPGIGAAFVDVGHEQAGYLYLNQGKSDSEIPSWEHPPLREGGQVLVQIYRESVGIKGPKLTRDITLIGRYIVYMPLLEHTNVSRRIQLPQERERLEAILRDVCPEGKGVIARTRSEGQSPSMIQAEFHDLELQWKNIQHNYSEMSAPRICHQELDFVQQILRDVVDEEVVDIWVDTPEQKAIVEGYVEKYLPWLVGKCTFYRESTPIFKNFDIEPEVDKSLTGKIYLRSGGVINIDQTEALVSVDVNTGRFVGKKSVEQTVLKTNLEAVAEIARQLRLRNCGGIIVIDFIDMEDHDHREQVFQALQEALKKDRSKCRVMPLSRLGLVEMTRKQTKDTLTRVVCQPCPYCEGSGRVKSASSVCYELLRDLTGAFKSRGKKTGPVSIHAHPDVVEKFCDEEGSGFREVLERSWGGILAVEVDHNCHMEQYEIVFEED